MSAVKTNTVRNAVDTFVSNAPAAQATKNFSRMARLAVESTNGRSYVYFGAPMPRGVKVTSAKLRLYTAGSWGGVSVQTIVKRLTAKFTASKVTWSGTGAAAKPASTATNQATLTKTSSGDGDVWEFDVTAIMQQVADGTAWYGFEVTTNSATRRFFRSSQVGSKRPELEVTYADVPNAPTTLNPNGQITGLTKPALEGDYTDPTGGTLTAAEVELSSAATGWDAINGFSAPTFSSGAVTVPAGSVARVDLAATAYAGAASGVPVYWTMRVQDESGQWSKWSNVASFTYTAKGTLTITSPSSATPTVTDYTPTVVSTVAGMTLKKARVVVVRTDTGAQVHDSGEFSATGTSLSYAVAETGNKAVLKKGVPYSVAVQAWDTLDRASTGTEKPFIEATQAFTVVDGATTAPTAMSLSVLSNPPRVQMDWTSATAPDGFAFTIDGEVVEADVLPSAVVVSGTSYRYTFRRPRPNVAQSFGVTATVNGVNSAMVAASATPKAAGVWLIDPTDSTRFLLLAKTGGSRIDKGEDSATLVPLGAESGIVITQGLRGYEGTIVGVLGGASFGHGMTLQQQVDLLLAMRREVGKAFVLLVGTEAFEVNISNATVRPTGDSAPNLRPASFDFVQTSAQREGGAL